MLKIVTSTKVFLKFNGELLVTLVFEEVTGKNVLLLPLGACDDGAHSQNEKINKTNYIQGSKVLAQYIYQLGQL